MLELTEVEFNDLRSQFGTSGFGGTRYMPMAFTEQGVAFLICNYREKSNVKELARIMLKYMKKNHGASDK